MKLYALKSGEQYLRIGNDGFQLVPLDKASVYPLARYPFLEEQRDRAQELGLIETRIIELLVIENEGNRD